MSFFNIILLSIAWASSDRISSIQKDLARAEKISLTPGLVSVLEFPQAITEVRVGHPGVLKALISSVSPRELTLSLSGASMAATNLIVRAERRIFVFDVVPSKASHQDYIRIRGGFGGPRFVSGDGSVLSSSVVSPAQSRREMVGTVILQKRLGVSK